MVHVQLFIWLTLLIFLSKQGNFIDIEGANLLGSRKLKQDKTAHSAKSKKLNGLLDSNMKKRMQILEDDNRLVQTYSFCVICYETKLLLHNTCITALYFHLQFYRLLKLKESIMRWKIWAGKKHLVNKEYLKQMKPLLLLSWNLQISLPLNLLRIK